MRTSIPKLNVPWHGLLGLKTEPMSEDMSYLFITLLSAEHGSQSKLDSIEKEAMDKPIFAYAVLNKRLLAIDQANVSIPVKMFCACMCKSPGDAVMWAYTLHYMAVALDRKITMTELADAFPMGFPTKEELHRAWDAQKGGAEGIPKQTESGTYVDNWVDHFDWWPKKK